MRWSHQLTCEGSSHSRTHAFCKNSISSDHGGLLKPDMHHAPNVCCCRCVIKKTASAQLWVHYFVFWGVPEDAPLHACFSIYSYCCTPISALMTPRSRSMTPEDPTWMTLHDPAHEPGPGNPQKTTTPRPHASARRPGWQHSSLAGEPDLAQRTPSGRSRKPMASAVARATETDRTWAILQKKSTASSPGERARRVMMSHEFQHETPACMKMNLWQLMFH